MKKAVCLCLMVIFLVCVFSACQKEGGLQNTTGNRGATTIATTTKAPSQEKGEAPDDFIFGTFTKRGFVNEWMNLKFTPYSNMYSNPETVILSYEASLKNPEYHYIAMEIMEYYVREGTTSNGYASVLVQKLKKTISAEDYLEDCFSELEDAFRPYPQLSVVRGEKGEYELCGEQYVYQEFSVLGGVNGTSHTMNLHRILDGYAITIQIDEGYYTIEEQLACFEAIH